MNFFNGNFQGRLRGGGKGGVRLPPPAKNAKKKWRA